jgi:hypothetical protein
MVRREIPDWGSIHQLRLGTFTVRVRRGRPSIEIVDRRPGQDFGETRIETGTYSGPFEMCADGLPYGGQANRAPVLTRIADWNLRAGTSDGGQIAASDRDGDALTFRLKSGPPFVSVSTLAHDIGVIRVAPDSCTRGVAQCVVEVSDGFATDTDTFAVTVRPLTGHIPECPVRASEPANASPVAAETEPFSAAAIVGNWEWAETKGWRTFYTITPASRGYRRHLIFRADGTALLFEIRREGPLKCLKVSYSVEPRGQVALLRLSQWFDLSHRQPSFAISRKGSHAIGLYPVGFHHADEDTYVSVPGVDFTEDTLSAITPQPPSVTRRNGHTDVHLPPAMDALLRRCDPSFDLWDERDDREVFPGASTPGGQAIVGDFDGDMLPDVALLGRSGADQVIIAILSDHGSGRALEVAWRRVKRGTGVGRSRGDPKHVAPIHLELAPRGAPNPSCLGSHLLGAPLDAVGISTGETRFDFWLNDARFELFAPVP